MARAISTDELQRALDIFQACDRNYAHMSRILSLARSTCQNRIRLALEAGMAPGEPAERLPVELKHAKTANYADRWRKTFILTAAQDDTPLHEALWANILAYADHKQAEIKVGGYTYAKGLFEDHKTATAVYPEELHEFLCPVEEKIADSIWWCGHANILPTTTNPVSGWETRHGGDTIILPHARIQMTSVPRMPGHEAKFVLTTGVVTHPNYIQRNSGMKAEFHHTLGFAIVEIDSDGESFIRTVSASSDGSFRDLDVFVNGEVVTCGNSIEALTAGDIHFPRVDTEVCLGTFGFDPFEPKEVEKNNILDVLKPKHVFLHDVLDFRARNHHNRKDTHFLAQQRALAEECVKEEVKGTVAFIRELDRPFSTTVIVESNHDTALTRWLKDHDCAKDAVNAGYWHWLNHLWYKEIDNGNSDYNIVESALRGAANDKLHDVQFVPEGASFTICQTTKAPIECGVHGHAGTNGSRGGPASFAKSTPRLNIGHTHSPQIRDGVYVAGLTGELDQGYNKSLSSWCHGHIITHSNGKRQIVIPRGRKWRA